jgi:hypothetical protein
MGRFNEELKKAGVFRELEGLAKPATATRVRFDGEKRVVTDGPFTESKEQVGGFWIWECKSKAEAIEWLKRAPFYDHEVEIREVLEGFGERFASALREQQLAEARA